MIVERVQQLGIEERDLADIHPAAGDVEINVRQAAGDTHDHVTSAIQVILQLDFVGELFQHPAAQSSGQSLAPPREMGLDAVQFIQQPAHVGLGQGIVRLIAVPPVGWPAALPHLRSAYVVGDEAA